MKVSLNWVKEYANIKGSADDIAKKIGSQLGEVESVQNLGSKYDGILVVRVVSCQKHPNADKLSLCMVDDNKVVKGISRDSSGYIQVVCGAPNVREGMLAAWIPPGVIVPSTVDKDPFVLEQRELRGQVSNGMLASLRELAISDEHEGILDINAKEVGKDLSRPGTPLKKLYGLDDDIIDIENKMFTHRPDCFGQLGVAREISGITHKTFKSPEWYLIKSTEKTENQKSKSLSVDNRIPDVCKRYMAVEISGVSIKPSPVWIQSALSRIGIRPINNIVDITNYMMMLTGQPLHAFDFDKVAHNGTAKIVIRKPKKDEKMTLLDGSEISPRADAVLICNQDVPIALGGVMGGNNSEIDSATKNIIVECANFDMYNIRRTAMEHGLFTDSVTRFNKGQSADQCSPVLDKTISLIIQQCNGAKVSGNIIDCYPGKKQNNSVAISAEFVNTRLGSKLGLKDISRLLENVEFQIKSVPADKNRLHVKAPFWRTDIEIPEDLVEEIGRLYGYDNLPAELPSRSISPVERNNLMDLKNKIRNVLAKSGANELLTYTFVHGNLLEKVGQDKNEAFQLSNALSPDLQYYRLSLLPSLLEKVHTNLKSDRIRGDDNEFALFEINPVHSKEFVDEDGLPIEDLRLAFVFAADVKTALRKYQGAAYFAAVKYVNELLEELGISAVFTSAKDHKPEATISKAAIAPFDADRYALLKTTDGKFLGEIGEFSPSTRRNLKLPDFVAGFELDVTQLLKSLDTNNQYIPLPRYPKVMQDITLKVPIHLAYNELKDFLDKHIIEHKPDNSFFQLGMPRIYQSEDESNHKNITLRLWISHYDRTLKTDEVNKLLDDISVSANQIYGAERG